MKKKTLTKAELALMYFPDDSPNTARHHLMAWIKRSERLTAALDEIGYNKQSKYLSPKEIKLIMDYLGEP